MNRISQTVPYQYDTGFSPYSVAELDKALCDLEAYGFTGVEFAVAYPDQVNADEMLKKAESHKLSVTTLSTGQIVGLAGITMTASDEETRLKAREVICNHIELSSRIGRPPVTIGLLRGKCMEEDKTVLEKRFLETLLPCVDFAEKKNVYIQVEPINRNECGYIKSTDDWFAVWEKAGRPERVSMLFDVFHSRIEDGDSIKAIQKAGSHITNVHFADSNRGLPGTGEMDFPALYKAIVATGYRGAFALETQCVPTKEYVLKNYADSIKKIVTER